MLSSSVIIPDINNGCGVVILCLRYCCHLVRDFKGKNPVSFLEARTKTKRVTVLGAKCERLGGYALYSLIIWMLQL